jgi:butyryl-CoA dehydrogenase
MVKETLRRFVDTEVIPVASEMDAAHEWPEALLKKLAGMGAMGMPIPRELGGAGNDIVSYVIALEELARAWASLAIIVAVHTSVGTLPILQHGTDEQKQHFIPGLASGKKLGGFALTEPEAGSDVSGLKTTAVKQGDEYILNGGKVFITNGKYADYLVILAVTDPKAGHRGLSTFIVEKGMDGYSYGTTEEKMGIHSSDTTELIFEDCRVPEFNLLGGEGKGMKVSLSALDGGRIGVGAQCVGLARAALEESLKYAQERQQFGRPIAKFQAIQWFLADMATRIDAARLLVHRAADMKDKGMKYTTEASMAKVFASETAMWCTNKAIQVHGGYGYTKDYPVERFFRDAKVTEIYEGTSEIQRLVIARNLLK